MPVLWDQRAPGRLCGPVGPASPVASGLKHTGYRALYRGFLQGSVSRERSLRGVNPCVE